MAQISYGTITITDTNDIESITVEYNRNQSSSNAPSATDSGWSTTRPDWAQGYYIWQRTRIHKSGTAANTDVIGTAVCITGSTGSTGAPGRGLTDTTTQYCNYGTGEPADDYSGWVDAPPNYDSSKPNYWVMITNTYSATPTSEIIKYKDEALTKAVADAAVANSIATHSNENAQGAMSQASAALQRVQAKYGTSSTGSSTVAKVATCEGFELFNGAEVFIKFTNKNTAENPTLNVNNTGAKSVKDSDGNNLAEQFYWKDNSLVHFVYDGTNWRILDIVTTEKYNNLVSDINGVSSTVGQHTTTLNSLGTRVDTAETNITQTATSITSLASNQSTYIKPDGTTGTNTIQSAIKQNADNIDLKVSKDGVIASINASVETSGGSAVKISADKVNIEGAAIFTSGRLSTTNLENTIDGRIPEIPDDLSDLTDNTGIIPDISGLASKTDTVKSVTTETQYRLSNSSTNLSGSGTGYTWSTTIPTWSANTYLWTRIATTYTPISGTATTVYKPGVQANEYGIYDSQLTIALSTANTANINANNAAATITTTQQYRLSTSSTNLQGSGTGYEWNSTIPTWVSNTYLWTRFKIDKTTIGGTTTTSYTPGIEANEYGIYDSALTTALSTAASAQSKADAAAPKSSAVAKTQQIYYRSNSSSKPTVYPTTWVTAETNKWNNGNVSETNFNGWRRKVTPISDGVGQNVTKYLYLWTATQKQLVDGTVVTLTADDIALDDSTTVIDGGKIITGSVTANQLNAADINASNSLTIGALTTNTQNNILNSELTDDINKTAWSVIVTTVGTPNYITPSVTLKATVYHYGTIETTGFIRNWYKNGTGVSLGTGETITISAVADLDAFYVCVVSEAQS